MTVQIIRPGSLLRHNTRIHRCPNNLTLEPRRHKTPTSYNDRRGFMRKLALMFLNICDAKV